MRRCSPFDCKAIRALGQVEKGLPLHPLDGVIQPSQSGAHGPARIRVYEGKACPACPEPDPTVVVACSSWKLSRGSKEISPNISFHVVTSDPGINLPFALDGLGITVLPLWLAKHPDNRNRLVPILPLWKPEPITLCALFSGLPRLTPKVEELLDFLAEYVGTDRDPRVKHGRAKEYFTDLTLSPTSGS